MWKLDCRLFVIGVAAIALFLVVFVFTDSPLDFTRAFSEKASSSIAVPTYLNASVAATAPGSPSTERVAASHALCPMAVRLDSVRAACSHGPPSGIDRPKQIWVLVDNNRKMLYTKINKAGSRSWTTFLQRINNIPEEEITQRKNTYLYPNCRNGLCYQQLNYTELETTYKDYTKIASVRHPLQRLVSAYFDFVVESHWSKDMWPQMQKEFWGREFVSKTLSFIEFAWKLMSSQTNKHWWNYIYDLQPCDIPYNYIFKLETLYEDTAFLAKELGEPELQMGHSHNNAFFNSDSPGGASGTEVDQLTRYDNFLRELRDNRPDILDYWLDYYRSAMDMFGYAWDGSKATSLCRYGNGDDVSDCC